MDLDRSDVQMYLFFLTAVNNLSVDIFHPKNLCCVHVLTYIHTRLLNLKHQNTERLICRVFLLCCESHWAKAGKKTPKKKTMYFMEKSMFIHFSGRERQIAKIQDVSCGLLYLIYYSLNLQQ